MKVRVLRPALEDLTAGRCFYDRREAGVGGYFLQVLFAEVDSLARYGGIHRIQFGFHRSLVKKFPYGIYYRVIANEAVVFRILDCRRNPNWIRQALQAER
jgi:hypothetical protein